MVNGKAKFVLGSASMLAVGLALAMQQPEQTGGQQQSSTSATDSSSYYTNLAGYDYAIREQECETLKFSGGANAVHNCLRNAEQQRDDMMRKGESQLSMNDKSGTGITGGQRADTQAGGSTRQGGPGKAGLEQAQKGPESQAGGSVVEKVKDTVKETWSELTNGKTGPGEAGGRPEGKDPHAEANNPGTPGGMMAQGGNGMAFYCRPVSTAQLDQIQK